MLIQFASQKITVAFMFTIFNHPNLAPYRELVMTKIFALLFIEFDTNNFVSLLLRFYFAIGPLLSADVCTIITRPHAIIQVIMSIKIVIMSIESEENQI